jgi:hypothetical protein
MQPKIISHKCYSHRLSLQELPASTASESKSSSTPHARELVSWWSPRLLQKTAWLLDEVAEDSPRSHRDHYALWDISLWIRARSLERRPMWSWLTAAVSGYLVYRSIKRLMRKHPSFGDNVIDFATAAEEIRNKKKSA